MPYLNNTELKVKKTEDFLKNLINEIEQLQKQTEQLFSDLNICPDQFSTHTENPANFTKDEWQRLQDHKLKLDQKFDMANHHLVDPLKTTKTRSEMQASQHWLFVR